MTLRPMTLAERMLPVHVVEQVEGDAADLDLVAQEPVADARVEELVRVEVERLLDDLLLLDTDDLLGPVLRRHDVEVDRRVDPERRAELRAGVGLHGARARSRSR